VRLTLLAINLLKFAGHVVDHSRTSELRPLERLVLSQALALKEAAINFSTAVLRSSGAETSRPDWANDDGGPERHGREELRGITQPNSVEDPRLGLGQHHGPPTRAVGSGRGLPRRPTSELTNLRRDALKGPHQ